MAAAAFAKSSGRLHAIYGFNSYRATASSRLQMELV